MKHIFLLFAIAILAACGDTQNNRNDENNAAKEQTPPDAEAENIQAIKPTFTTLDENVSGHIRKTFEEYFKVKSALVNSNSADAKLAARSLGETVKNFDKSLLTPDQLQSYNKEVGGIKALSNEIGNTDDLNKQREQFAALSVHAYGLAKSFGAGKTVYHDHCPMAFENKGAMWLSETKTIQNPFFGEKMIRCGSVQEVIE